MKKLALTLTALFALGMFMPASAGPGFKIKDVDEFAFFQPCACIDMYCTNGGYYSQPQTDKAAGMVADIINMENFPFSDMIPADYYGDGANAYALRAQGEAQRRSDRPRRLGRYGPRAEKDRVRQLF